MPDEARRELAAPGLLESLWASRTLVLVMVVVTGAIGYSVTQALPKRWSASAHVLLADPSLSITRAGASSAADLSRYTTQRADFARSLPVLSRASSLLGDSVSVPSLRDSISTSVATNANIVFITATTSSARSARDEANAVGQAYVDMSLSQAQAREKAALDSLDTAERTAALQLAPTAAANPPPQVVAAREAYAQMLLQSANIGVDAAIFGSGVVYLDPAPLPASAGALGTARNTLIGALLGFLLALVIAWVKADRRRTVEDGVMPAAVIGAPHLGDVPELSKGSKALADFASMPATEFQIPAALLTANQPEGVVLVTGAKSRQGATTLVANVGVAVAKEGRLVLLIDGDSRTRKLSRLAGVPDDQPGLAELARGVATVDSCLVTIIDDGDVQLRMIPAGRGSGDTSSALRSKHMATLMKHLSNSNSLVLIDSSPLASSPESASLAQHADGVLLAIGRGTPVQVLDELVVMRSLFPAALIGYVFTRASRPRSGTSPRKWPWTRQA